MTTSTDFTVEHLPLSRLQPNTGNVRKDLGDLADLTESIKAQGVLQPAVVAPSPTAKTKFVLITGHRRHAAAKAAGLKTLPCIVREDIDTPAKQIEAMLVENAQRLDLTPIEEGDAYQQLLDLPDYSVKALATRLGHPQTFIRNRVKVAGTPDRIRAGVIDGQITLEQALVFAEAADHPDLIARLERELGTYNWQWQVQSVRDSIRARREAATKVKQLEKQGVQVHESSGAALAAVQPSGDDAPDVDLVDLADLRDLAIEKAYLDERERLQDDTDADALAAVDEKYSNDDVAPPPLTDDGHAACPGRVVYRDGDRVVEACTQPKLHEDLTGADTVDTPTSPSAGKALAPSREAAAAAKQLEEDLATAAEVRIRHMLQVAKDPTPELAREFALHEAADALSGYRGREALAALGIVDADTAEPTYETIRAAIADWSIEQLVVVARLVLGSVFAAKLTEQDWLYSGLHGIRTIAAAGYTWSEVERQVLDRAGQQYVEAAGLAGDGDAE